MTDNLIIERLENSRVNSKTTIHLQFSLEKNLLPEDSIKFNFPQGFRLSNPKCFLHKVNICTEIELLLNERMFVCHGLNIELKAKVWHAISIIGVIAPRYSGIFDGLYLETFEEDSNNVLERISSLDSISIKPGAITAYLEYTSLKVGERSEYELKLNPENGIFLDEEIWIKLPSEFIDMDEYCIISSPTLIQAKGKF